MTTRRRDLTCFGGLIGCVVHEVRFREPSGVQAGFARGGGGLEQRGRGRMPAAGCRAAGAGRRRTPRRTARAARRRAAVALEPAQRAGLVALLVRSAGRGGSRRAGTRPRPRASGRSVVAEPVDVAVVGRARRRPRRWWRAAGVVGRDRAADARAAAGRRRHAGRRVRAASGRSGCRQSRAIGQEMVVGERLQRRRRLLRPVVRAAARRPATHDQPGVRPPAVVELPDAGVGLVASAARSRRRAASTARMPSAVETAGRSAAPRSSSDSPKASSWNCWLTWLPTRTGAPG